MTTRQFYFSGLTGMSLCISGALLASTGIASWGLFWVGAAVTGVALGFRLQGHLDAARVRIMPRGVRPATPWLDQR